MFGIIGCYCQNVFVFHMFELSWLRDFYSTIPMSAGQCRAAGNRLEIGDQLVVKTKIIFAMSIAKYYQSNYD